MEQAKILREFDFPTAMVLPTRDMASQDGVATGIRKFAEAFGKSVVVYLKFEEYLDLICEFVERLKPSIVIERLFGEAPLGLLVAPDWGKTRNEVILGIRRRMDELNVIQGAKYQPVSGLHP